MVGCGRWAREVKDRPADSAQRLTTEVKREGWRGRENSLMTSEWDRWSKTNERMKRMDNEL